MSEVGVQGSPAFKCAKSGFRYCEVRQIAKKFCMYGDESLKSEQTTKARQICYIISKLGYPHLDPLLCHLANTNYGSRLMMQFLLSLAHNGKFEKEGLGRSHHRIQIEVDMYQL